MKKLVTIGAAAVIAAGVSHAADVPFPNADGSFDLTSPAAWAPYAYPPTDRVKIMAGGTYTAGVDGTFVGGMIQANDTVTTFDLTRAGSTDGVLTLGEGVLYGDPLLVTDYDFALTNIPYQPNIDRLFLKLYLKVWLRMNNRILDISTNTFYEPIVLHLMV